MQLGARVSSGRGEELSDREAERVYERGRCTSARLSESLCLREPLPQRGAHIVQLLSTVRLQFLSCSFLNVMYISMFICTAVANEAARVGNASEA